MPSLDSFRMGVASTGLTFDFNGWNERRITTFYARWWGGGATPTADGVNQANSIIQLLKTSGQLSTKLMLPMNAVSTRELLLPDSNGYMCLPAKYNDNDYDIVIYPYGIYEEPDYVTIWHKRYTVGFDILLVKSENDSMQPVGRWGTTTSHVYGENSSHPWTRIPYFAYFWSAAVNRADNSVSISVRFNVYGADWYGYDSDVLTYNITIRDSDYQGISVHGFTLDSILTELSAKCTYPITFKFEATAGNSGTATGLTPATPEPAAVYGQGGHGGHGGGGGAGASTVIIREFDVQGIPVDQTALTNPAGNGGNGGAGGNGGDGCILVFW